MLLAQFLLDKDAQGLFAARKVSGRMASDCPKVVLPGGRISDGQTLETVCAKQGWSITKGEKILEKNDGKQIIQWFTGEAKLLNTTATDGKPMRADQDTLERGTRLHNDAFDALDELED